MVLGFDFLVDWWFKVFIWFVMFGIYVYGNLKYILKLIIDIILFNWLVFVYVMYLEMVVLILINYRLNFIVINCK